MLPRTLRWWKGPTPTPPLKGRGLLRIDLIAFDSRRCRGLPTEPALLESAVLIIPVIPVKAGITAFRRPRKSRPAFECGPAFALPDALDQKRERRVRP